MIMKGKMKSYMRNEKKKKTADKRINAKPLQQKVGPTR